MAASSGGGRDRDDERPSMKSLLERAGATGSGALSEARSLDEILPDRGDAGRARDMQATWQAFCLERHDMVRLVLDSDGTAPEIAYRVGELVHTYFRPRGVTLTCQELRLLVTELIGSTKRPPKPGLPKAEPPKVAPHKPSAASSGAGHGASAEPLVSFRGAPKARDTSWTGDEKPSLPPDVSDKTFDPTPSILVTVNDRAAVTFERLLGRTLELARPRLAMPAGRIGRAEALRGIDAVVDEVLRTEKQPALAPELRERIVLMALSEICGLGLIDRLWADRSVRAVFVNGPDSVFVERESGLAPAGEVFRDREHLLELVSRLVPKPASGVAAFRLRDGGGGTVVFPPTAPNGPVLTIRRGDPGQATLALLIASGLLDAKSAALLRVAARARLNIAVLGPPGAGKTAILAALAYDLAPSSRLVTLARHRAFRWAAPAKVELVVSNKAPYATLIDAAERLQPQTWLLDSLQPAETRAVLALIARGARGLVMAGDSAVLLPELTRSIDLLVRLGRGQDGGFQAVSLEDARGAAVLVRENGRIECRIREPAFRGKVLDAGFGEALAALLR